MYPKTDSTTGQIANYNLHKDAGYTIPVEWVNVPEDIAALPDLVGYGNVCNLQQAMAMDATGELKTLVGQFIAEEDPANRINIMEQILFHWTDSEDITAKRGNMDGRQLATLEKFVGEDFIGMNGADPNRIAQPILEQIYQNLLETYYCRLMVQTHLQDLYDKITYTWDETAQTTKVDLSAVITELQNRLTSDPQQGRQDLGEFARSMRSVGVGEMNDYLLFRETFINMDETLGYVMDTANGNRTGDAVYGTDSNETLTNGNQFAAIAALGGNDIIYAGAGGDILDGRAGNDTLYGEGGNDTYIFRRGDGRDTVIDNDSTAGNIDTIWLDSDITPDDIIVNQSGNNLILRLRDTEDAITVQGYYQSYSTAYRIERVQFAGGTVWDAADIEQQKLITQVTEGDDIMYGTAQDDVLSGLHGNDIIYGGSGNDSLAGNEDDDLLFGGTGADMLDGGTGADQLYGEYGNDILDGGSGNDIIDGGTGNDTYLFGRGSGRDTIIDQDNTAGNQDAIVLNSDITPADVTLRRSGENLALTIKATGETLTVNDWFLNESFENQVEQIRFADSTVWDVDFIKQMALQSTSGDDAANFVDKAGENNVIYLRNIIPFRRKIKHKKYQNKWRRFSQKENHRRAA